MAILKENNGDASASTGTGYSISLGDYFQGTVEDSRDNDWVRVELDAGTVYEIRLEGEDVLHIELLDSDGKHILTGNHISGSLWHIAFNPTVSGTYYINIRPFIFENNREYGLSFVENTTPIGTYDDIADFMINGYREWLLERPSLAFDVESGGVLTANITALPEAGQQLARWSLEAWTSVTDIQFEFVDDDNAHIIFSSEDKRSTYSYIAELNGDVIISSVVNIASFAVDDFDKTGIDIYTMHRLLHETGHALGLGHPGPYNGVGFYGSHNAYLIDSRQASVESYIFQSSNSYVNGTMASVVTPMIADIIALHNLYGTPTGIRAGDTVYGYQSNLEGYLGVLFELWTGGGDLSSDYDDGATLTLYDGGGTDTLDLRTDADDQRIDLSPEGISDVYGLVGNLVIARDTLIENVIAGAGDDRIIGNSVANRLDGGPGADHLDGSAGADWVSYQRSEAGVTVNFLDGTAAGGHAEGDVLVNIENIFGSNYADTLTGDAGANRLDGGPGADRLDGGAGEDWVSYQRSGAAVTINLGAGTVSGGHARGDVLVNIENITGSVYDDVLTGDGGANRLEGGAGADRLTGGAGEDTASYAQSDAGVVVRLHSGEVRGGDAAGDTFDVMETIEYVDGNGDTQQEIVPDIEHLQGSAHADTLAGDSRANRLEGGPGDDRLYGGPGGGDDVLWGGPGEDALFGGIGDDVLEGGPDADTLRGGPGADTASYAYSDAGVEVRLHSGVAQAGHAEGDVLDSIENVSGSAYADILEGDEVANRLDGGAGVDWVSYRGSDAGVTVKLRDSMGEGGHAEGDVIVNIENIEGSDYNDIFGGNSETNHLVGGAGNDGLWGSNGDDILEGGAGADRMYGGIGVDRISYRGSDAGVTVDLGSGRGQGGHAEGDVFADVENIAGSDHDDVLTGDDDANRLEGGAGADRLDGGAGVDWVTYAGSNAGVTVNLASGIGEGGDAGGDVIVAVENIAGSDYGDALTGDGSINELTGGDGDDALWGSGGNDVLAGGAGADRLEGGAGADRLDGGSGLDWASYLGSDAGVTVDLRDGSVAGGHAEGDVIVSIENVTGSEYADVLTGDDGANRFEGGAGADRLDGGSGEDWVSYQGSAAGVIVNLKDGTAEGGHAEGDVIADFENVIGSAHDDMLVGNIAVNQLYGGDGNDELRGGGSNDRLEGGAGDDVLNGGAGADILDGGPGEDWVSYQDMDGGVRIDLVAGWAIEGYTYKNFSTLDFSTSDDITGIENALGSQYADEIRGDDDDNHLIGGDGDDIVVGEQGDDILEGGAGDDRLIVSYGTDTLVFDLGHGDDVIFDQLTDTDFDHLIDLTAFNLSGYDALDISSVPDGVLIDLTEHGGGTILIEDNDIAGIDASDFLF